MIGHRPAHDMSAPGIDDHGQVKKSRPSWNVGDIGHPEAIGTGCVEVALDKIVCVLLRLLTPCRASWRIRRAIRFRPIETPSARSSALTRGTP